MSNSNTDGQDLNVHDAIKLLITESRRRPIVPFLGSGLSYAAGYPTIRGVIEYLAKLDFAILNNVYRHRYSKYANDQFYIDHPSLFVEDFGWPTIGGLNSDLWNWLKRPSKGCDAILGECEIKYKNTTIALDYRDRQRAIVQSSLRRILSEKESGADNAIKKEWHRWKEWYLLGKLGEEADKPELLYGDWDEMLYRLCEGNLDLVDSLFTSFERGRRPTLAHRYLTFLIDKLSIPLVFTTNFDSFLERAMTEERIEHRSFDVHRDAALPHVSLVQRQTSILKLHGSAYGLRVGERLKYPVESQAREMLLSYVPEEPLFLVTGFSGSERRMMQVLDTFVKNDGLGKCRPRMLWLEGPGKRGDMLKQFAIESKDTVKFAKIADVSTFLQQLFFHYAGGYQASTVPYSALPGRPAFSIKLPDSTGKEKETVRKKRLTKERKPVQIFSSNHPDSSWGGLAAAKFAAERAKEGYSVIWIDIEKHHTVAGTVAEILEKAKTYEPESPSFTLVTEKDRPDANYNKMQKAVERIHDALKQGRYVLVLDSIESYGRPQFQHHGVPSFRLEQLKDRHESWTKKGQAAIRKKEEFIGLVDFFFDFLSQLVRKRPLADRMKSKKSHNISDTFHDSYICLSIGVPSDRHGGIAAEQQEGHPCQSSDHSESWKYVNDKLLLLQGLDDVDRDHIERSSQKVGGDYTSLGLIHEGKDLERINSKAPWSTSNMSNDPSKDSESRLRSFLTFKKKLGDIQNCTEEDRRDHAIKVLSHDSIESRDALLGMLSIFRRPRSIACIRSMTERWGVASGDKDRSPQVKDIRDGIDDLLQRQIILGENNHTNEPHGMLHEGGSVWLFREIHLPTYSAMTDSLSATDWVLDCFSLTVKHRKKKEKDIVCALIDGILATSLHTEASRVYYADTFMPTNDLETFYEYLYHRCYSIRTLSLLLGILNPSMGKIAENAFAKASETVGLVFDQVFGSNHISEGQIAKSEAVPEWKDALARLSVFAPLDHAKKKKDGKKATVNVNENTIDGFVERLTQLRSHVLKTLIGAIQRQESFLRVSATPDTLSGWLDQLKDVVRPEVTGEAFHAGEYIPETKSEFGKLVKDLDSKINRLRIKVGTGRVEDGEESGKAVRWDNQVKEVNDAEDVAKKQQTQACFLWTGMDNPEYMRPWIVSKRKTKGSDRWEGCSDSDVTEANEVIRKVKESKMLALKYEFCLRSSTRDSYLDARHRSCALALLARSEYLLGHFRQAQHRLDVAAGGLSYSPVHKVSRSLIHTYRAELMIYSADEHFNQQLREVPDGSLTWLDVAKELRKVNRADKEIRTALNLMGESENLTRWRALAHLGVAQVQMELMLFQSEDIFVRRKSLPDRLFSETFGRFEQVMLDGLRNLRAALDLIPYVPDEWSVVKSMATSKNTSERRFFFEYSVETKVWSLWRQFYIAAAYFDGLMSVYSTHSDLARGGLIDCDSHKVLQYIAEQAKHVGAARWKNWNESVRFESLSEVKVRPESSYGAQELYLPNILDTTDLIQSKLRSSLRMLQVLVMEDDLKDREHRISLMWKKRRNPK